MYLPDLSKHLILSADLPQIHSYTQKLNIFRSLVFDYNYVDNEIRKYFDYQK